MELKPVPKKVVDTVKVVCAEAVEAAKSGHPGTCMGAAEASLVLWGSVLRFDPSHPDWQGRDRFILSAGHASMLIYSLLHLFGYALPLDELKKFRQWGSMTPGHPEYHFTPGVEVTTGPLGQGLAHGVGMALGQAMLGARVNTPEFSPAGGRVYVLTGDGCMMEGISYEACSLAGHLGLGNLTVIYDRNKITIEGSTELAFTEDVGARFKAQNWQVLEVDGYDQKGLFEALAKSAAETKRPTLIISKSVIGQGAPTKGGTKSTHGEPLGAEELKRFKESVGWPAESFHVPQETRDWCQARLNEKKREYADWQEKFQAWRKAHPDLAKVWDDLWNAKAPEDLDTKVLEGLDLSAAATRAHSGRSLNKIASMLPRLIGGSADLNVSNNSDIIGGGDVGLAKEGGMAASWKGRILHFGIREHAMAAAVNGLNLHGAWRAFGATFLQFADYCRPSLRLAAFMRVPSVFIFTHDSIFLGEDGPTHQAVEHLAALRVVPCMNVWRPADGLETAMAWTWAVMRADGPVAMALSRQKLQPLAYPEGFQARQVWKGGYVLKEAAGAQATLIGTGSETALCMEAAKLLEKKGLKVRVVSMPCTRVFEAQDPAYKKSVLGSAPMAAVEAGVTYLWQAVVGPEGLVIGVDRFGASAPTEVMAEKFGFTPPQVAEKVEAWMKGCKEC